MQEFSSQKLYQVFWGFLICQYISCEISCDIPPPIQNGTILELNDTDLTTFQYGFMVTYVCDEGYRIVTGQSQISCEEGGWSGETPSCEEIFCDSPPPILHGTILELSDTNLTTFPYGFQVNYHCYKGYRIVTGEEWRTCGVRGWSGKTPSCEEVFCDLPPPVRFATIVELQDTNQTTFPYGFLVTYDCDVGYRIVIGQSQRWCEARGWSGRTPICEGEECPELGAPTHGDILVTNYRVGSKVRFICYPGYELLGSDELHCLTGRLWSDNPPRCSPPKVSCYLPPSIRHGTVLELHVTSLTIFPYGFQVTYVCDEGYRIFTGRRRRMCGKRGWSGMTPRCEEMECPEPGAPTHGEILVTSYRVGSKVRFICYPGYELLGSDELHCLAGGQWSGEPARCNAPSNYCPDPGAPIGGWKNTTEYAEGERVSFHCKPGHILVGSEVRVCLPNRTWSGLEPRCIGPNEFDSELQAADMQRVKGLREKQRFPVSPKTHDLSRDISPPNSTGLLDTSLPGSKIMYFLFDVSSSINPHNFKRGVSFVKAIVKKVGISKDGVLAGALTFSVGAKPQFLPIQHKSTEAVLAALDNIEYEGGRGSDISSALREIRENTMPVMKHFLGERGANSVIFLLTDGKVNMGGDPKKEASILKAEGVEIICVGVTADVRKRTLYHIASISSYRGETRPNVFVLREYKLLAWAVQVITKGSIDFSECGLGSERVSSRRRRIISGKKSVRGSWPWMAALFEAGQIRITCGGSIIHRRFILTAAHCMYTKDGRKRWTSEIIIKLGLTSLNDTTFQELDIRRIHVHPSYVNRKSADYDIALLELETPIAYSPNIRPICLPPTKIPEDSPLYKPDSVAWATGWGSTKPRARVSEPDDTGSDVLREVALPLQPMEICNDSVAGIGRYKATDRMFCAGGGGLDTCKGDSGGPAMKWQMNDLGDLVWTQVGITSWGVGCGQPGKYAFFTHTQVFRLWVDATIEKVLSLTGN